MKFFKYSFVTMLTAILLMGVTNVTYAQDYVQAVKVYNKAREMAKNGNYQKSITMYTQALDIASQLGEKGQKIVKLTKEQLPKVYYQRALNVYKNFQSSQTVGNMDKAISSFKTAVEMANKYGNSDITSQAKGVITQLYYQKSLLLYQQGNYSAAMDAVNKAIERNPNYAKAYYQKALITKNTGTVDEYLAAIDKAIEVANSTNSSQVAQQAKESVSAGLVYIGAQRVQNENYSGAIPILKKALNYNPESANAYFRLAQAYNAGGNWQQAIDAAQKALNYANGGSAAKAKIYFALGTAYKGVGQYNKACDAFSNAAYGSFRRSAEHQMEYVLQCGG